MTSLTFGQLVEQQQLKNPSADVVKASEYVIQFGKHKGMNLAMLMEQQNGYCTWLLKQDESQNSKFNDAVHHLKILILDSQVGLEDVINPPKPETIQAEVDKIEMAMNVPSKLLKVDGVEIEIGAVVEGGKTILHIDPANPQENGIYKVDSQNSFDKLSDGLLMGKLSDLLEQVEEGGLSFEFSGTDIGIWVKLVKELKASGMDTFVIIETKNSTTSDSQRIKKIIPSISALVDAKWDISDA